MRAVSDKVRILLPERASEAMRTAAGVFARQVEARCGAEVILKGQAPFTVELAVEPGIGAEGFRIADGKDGAVRVIGNDERGVLYGAPAEANPWGGATLEWKCSSPPPHDNFAHPPVAGDPYDFTNLVYDPASDGYVEKR